MRSSKQKVQQKYEEPVRVEEPKDRYSQDIADMIAQKKAKQIANKLAKETAAMEAEKTDKMIALHKQQLQQLKQEASMERFPVSFFVFINIYTE